MINTNTKALKSTNDKLYSDLLNNFKLDSSDNINLIADFLKDYDTDDLPLEFLITSKLRSNNEVQIDVTFPWHFLNDYYEYQPYLVSVTAEMLAEPKQAAKKLLADYYQKLLKFSKKVEQFNPAQVINVLDYDVDYVLFSKEEYTNWLMARLDKIDKHYDIDYMYLSDPNYVAECILMYADSYHHLNPIVLNRILYEFVDINRYSTTIKQLVIQVLKWVNIPGFMTTDKVKNNDNFNYNTLLILCHKCGIKKVTLPAGAIYTFVSEQLYHNKYEQQGIKFSNIILKIRDDYDLDLILNHYYWDKRKLAKKLNYCHDLQIDFNGYADYDLNMVFYNQTKIV